MTGDIRFSMTAKRGTARSTVQFDLAELGATERSLPNVVKYLNGKLQAAGVLTRFAVERPPQEARTVTAGGNPVPLPAGLDRFALRVMADSPYLTAQIANYEAALNRLTGGG